MAASATPNFSPTAQTAWVGIGIGALLPVPGSPKPIGQDPAIAKIGGQTAIVASTTGSATIELFDTSGKIIRTINQAAYGPGSNATDRSGTINLFESASLGKLLPGAPVDVVNAISAQNLILPAGTSKIGTSEYLRAA